MRRNFHSTIDGRRECVGVILLLLFFQTQGGEAIRTGIRKLFNLLIEIRRLFLILAKLLIIIREYLT